MNKKRMYLVHREVFATSIEQAITAPGKVYSVELAADKDQPEDKQSNVGFTKKRVIQ